MFRCSRKFSAGTTQIVWNVIRLHSITRGSLSPSRPPWFRGWGRTCMTFQTTTQKIVFYLLFNRIFQKIFVNGKQLLFHVTQWTIGSHRRVVSSPAVLCDATRLLGKSVAWQHKKWVRRRISKGKWQSIIGRMRAQRDPSISTASQTG